MTRRPHPFDVVARVLAARLRGRAAPDELRALVCAPSLPWERVLDLASAQYVLPAFAAALRDLGLIGLLDADLRAFLLAVHAANAERNDELREELVAAVGILNQAGIQPVLLKGAIRLVDRLYPDRGWRVLRDLDLMVPHAQLPDAAVALERLGYAKLGLGADELGSPRRLAQIDLHRELFSTSEPAGFLPAAEIFDGLRPVTLGDGSVRVPALEHQLAHLIGHCQIRHLGHAFGHITLRNRLEAAALLRWAGQSVDLPAVAARFAAAGYRRPLLTFLLALRDGGMCAAPVPGRIDPLISLQRRRVVLQARSKTLSYIGARAGWWFAECRGQIGKRAGGERKAVGNLKRLISTRGAVWAMARRCLNRQRHLTHVVPHLAWIIATL
jgi:hypothetical protein